MIKAFLGLFKKKEKSAEYTVTITTEVNDNSEIYEAVKSATRLYNDNKIDEACELLYTIKNEVSMDTSDFVKLPLYLQKAGRFQESVDEMKSLFHLLKEHYSRNYNHTELVGYNDLLLHKYSFIFDKLRLIHQREKLYSEMMYFGVMSQVCECLALCMQDRKKEVKYRYLSNYKEKIVKFNKKAKLNDESLIKIIDMSKEMYKQCNLKYIDSFNEELSKITNNELWKMKYY